MLQFLLAAGPLLLMQMHFATRRKVSHVLALLGVDAPIQNLTDCRRVVLPERCSPSDWWNVGGAHTAVLPARAAPRHLLPHMHLGSFQNQALDSLWISPIVRCQVLHGGEGSVDRGGDLPQGNREVSLASLLPFINVWSV